MNLPTQAQVNTATRYGTAIAGTLFAILNLQALGVTLDQIKALIEALGSTANSVLGALSAGAALYAAYRGIKSSSNTGQAAAIGANKKTIVNPTSGGGAIITI